MNSRQRRRNLREYRFTVITDHDDYTSYLEAWEWLREHHGVSKHKKGESASWFERFEDDQRGLTTDQHARSPWYFRVRWYFKRKPAAVEFALRWS